MSNFWARYKFMKKRKRRKGSWSNYSRHKLIQPMKKVVTIIGANEDKVVVEIEEDDKVGGYMTTTTTTFKEEEVQQEVMDKV